jgi:putative rhamnosyltransferase
MGRITHRRACSRWNETMINSATHVLLTRFNTALGFAPSPKRLETKWLTSRLALFEQYCLPSVAAQQGAEFKWLVFFDAATPEWFQEKISAFEPLVTPIYIEGPATDEIIARRVMQTGFVASPYLISTRLDNDDAISKDHLASVQRAFDHQNREFITFPFGVQSFHNHLYNVYWPSNPFLSLIEKVSDKEQVTTVFCVPHDHVADANKVRKILRAPQWLQVLHDSNLGNILRGWPRLRSRRHPAFDVIWPDRSGPDSAGSRLRFSAKAYAARVDRLMKKLGWPENVVGA